MPLEDKRIRLARVSTKSLALSCLGQIVAEYPSLLLGDHVYIFDAPDSERKTCRCVWLVSLRAGAGVSNVVYANQCSCLREQVGMEK